MQNEYNDDPMNGFYRVLQWMNQSFHIGTILRTSVKIHISLFFFIAIFLLQDLSNWAWTLRWQALLFISVLLHEFGHVLACRHVHGRADEIIMWPLGGLALCDPPKNAKANFITVIWGPLVNVILMILSYIPLLLLLGFGKTGLSWNPFEPWLLPSNHILTGLLQDLFVVNYILLLFNLALMFYPFDGGRIVQCIIWWKTNYKKSMQIVIPVGVVGAIIVAILGLITSELFLLLIGLFGGYACYAQAQQMKMQMEIGDDSGGEGWLDLPQHFNIQDEPTPKPGWLQKRKDKKNTAKAQQQAADHAKNAQEVDAILDKVAKQGLHSLTRKERKILEQETNRRRKG